MYKLHVIKADNTTESVDYSKKPTFDDMYKHIGCDMIEMSKAYYPHYSNRKDGYVDIYFDEEFLMKESAQPNIGATVAWKKWQDKSYGIARICITWYSMRYTKRLNTKFKGGK